MGLRLHGRLTTLRAAGTGDVELLVGWHADPEVARFWDDKTYTCGEMLARLARRDVESFVIEADDEPVGYLQVWSGDERTGGLDMFLVPAARGRGLGPDAARTVANHLVTDRGWTRVTVDPYTWNEAAVRAWRRAGFEPVEERPADDGHTAAWLLMAYRSPVS